MWLFIISIGASKISQLDIYYIVEFERPPLNCLLKYHEAVRGICIPVDEMTGPTGG